MEINREQEYKKGDVIKFGQNFHIIMAVLS